MIAPTLVSTNDRNASIAFNYTTSSADAANGVTSNASYDQANIFFTNNAEYTKDSSFTSFGTHAENNYIHEIGHALGLNHPGPYDSSKGTPTYAANAQYAQDTEQYSIMSYFKADNDGTDHTDASGKYIFPQTPMLHDVATIQAMYGADSHTREGNTVYGFNSNAVRPEFDFTQNKTPVLTIWDGNGNDTLDVSGFNGNQTINLGAGQFSSVGNKTATEGTELNNNVAIAYGATIENAVGGSGNDKIYGNAVANKLTGGAGNDYLSAGDGNDTLTGGVFIDSLVGGTGARRRCGGVGCRRLLRRQCRRLGDRGADRHIIGSFDTSTPAAGTIRSTPHSTGTISAQPTKALASRTCTSPAKATFAPTATT